MQVSSTKQEGVYNPKTIQKLLAHNIALVEAGNSNEGEPTETAKLNYYSEWTKK